MQFKHLNVAHTNKKLPSSGNTSTSVSAGFEVLPLVSEDMSSFEAREASKALVVRVKRKRDEVANEELCLIGNDANNHNEKKKRKGFDSLHIQSKDPSPSSSLKTVVLSRVDTLEAGDERDIAVLLQQPQPRKRKVEEDSDGGRRVYIVCGNTPLEASSTTAKDNAFVLLDLRQIGLSSREASTASETSSLSIKGNRRQGEGVKLFSPISRQLGPAIRQAIDSLSCVPIQRLLQIYPMTSSSSSSFSNNNIDVNYTDDSLGGRTALMVATQLGNAPLVRTLLDRNADVGLIDAKGKSAIEYLERNNPKLEILLLLQQSLQLKEGAEVELAAVEEETGDYVYDIYAFRKKEASEEAVKDSTPEESAEERHIDNQWSYVHVPGLALGEDGYGCELVAFEYDEVWSDLGDDEEPDSNDERYFGNDYPEDELSGEEEDDRQEYEEEQWGGREEAASSDEEDQEEDRFPRFERTGVGRVLVPFSRNDPHLPVTQQHRGVQKLWSLRGGRKAGKNGINEEDSGSEGSGGSSGDDDEHERRLRHMHLRTGMGVAGNIAQFEASGLARYGGELSDDESDLRLLLENLTAAPGADRPEPGTIAYDSDLDREESSE